MTRTEATRLVRNARLAHRHERTGKALAAGDITSSHVDVLARAVRNREDLYPDGEDGLIDAATELSPDDFRYVARRWRWLADDEVASEDAKEQFERRRLYASATFGGMVLGDFELDPEGGATVLTALEARAKPDPVGSGPNRSRAQRMADALVQMAAESLGRDGQGGRPGRTVDVVIDVDTAAGRPPADLTSARCDLDRVGPIARVTAERLMCDCAIGRVLMKGRSEILDVGRRVRDITPAQRRALIRRDGGCIFPGCDRPHWWCDGHHLVPYEDGGPTDLANLGFLCRRHHVLCHEGGWNLARAPDGTVTAKPP